MPRPKLNFENLISPVSAEEFFARHWERAPLHVRHSNPGRYDSLLAPGDLDQLISIASQMPRPAIETLGDPSEGPSVVGAPASVADVYSSRSRGATVRLNGVQSFWKPVGDLAHRLEQHFACPVAVNLYSTPAGAQGAPRHYDEHDVLVLQLAGRKHWRVYEPVVRLPLKHVPPLAFEGRADELKYSRGGPKKGRGDIGDAESGPPTHEFELEPGDLLYLPRGFVHEAWTTGEESLHLTVGLHVLTWLDLFTVALGQLAQRDERFRRSLPQCLLHETDLTGEARAQFDALADSFARGASLQNALAEVAESFVRSRQAFGEGALAGAGEREEDIGPDTLLERRPGLLLRLLAEGDGVALQSAQNVLWMPKAFQAALGFVARAEEFLVGEIPGGLSEGGKLALARRLVQDGFVRVARVE